MGVAIVLCFAGVALIAQPKFLGFPDTGRLTALGIFAALFQARLGVTPAICLSMYQKPTFAHHHGLFYLLLGMIEDPRDFPAFSAPLPTCPFCMCQGGLPRYS